MNIPPGGAYEAFKRVSAEVRRMEVEHARQAELIAFLWSVEFKPLPLGSDALAVERAKGYNDCLDDIRWAMEQSGFGAPS